MLIHSPHSLPDVQALLEAAGVTPLTVPEVVDFDHGDFVVFEINSADLPQLESAGI